MDGNFLMESGNEVWEGPSPWTNLRITSNFRKLTYNSGIKTERIIKLSSFLPSKV